MQNDVWDSGLLPRPCHMNVEKMQLLPRACHMTLWQYSLVAATAGTGKRVCCHMSATQVCLQKTWSCHGKTGLLPHVCHTSLWQKTWNCHGKTELLPHACQTQTARGKRGCYHLPATEMHGKIGWDLTNRELFGEHLIALKLCTLSFLDTCLLHLMTPFCSQVSKFNPKWRNTCHTPEHRGLKSKQTNKQEEHKTFVVKDTSKNKAHKNQTIHIKRRNYKPGKQA